MILGLVPLRLRLLVFPPALLYHFAIIFTVSYFFHSSPCFLLILPPTQFPSPFSISFSMCLTPCQSPLPWRYVGLQNGEGKTCDTQCSCWSSHPRELREPWLSWDKNVYIIATVATQIRPPRKHEHTQTPGFREQVKKKYIYYQGHVLMLTVLISFSSFFTLFVCPNRWLVHLWNQWGKGCAFWKKKKKSNKQGHKGAGSSIFLQFSFCPDIFNASLNALQGQYTPV